MKFSILPLIALIFALVSCSSKTDLSDLPVVDGVTVGQVDPGPSEVIRVGDKLEIYILEDENFNGIYMVRDGGHVIFPKVGRVEVAGKTLSEAETTIKQAFEGPARQLVKATVILERSGARRIGPQGPDVVRIYLSGQVNSPGPLAVPYISGQQPTAYQALVHGGGAGGFAKLSKAYIIRNTGAGRQRIDVNLSDIGRGNSQDIPIQNGDIIVIPQKGFLF